MPWLRGLRAVIAGLLRLLLTTAAKYAAMRAVSSSGAATVREYFTDVRWSRARAVSVLLLALSAACKIGLRG